MVNADVVMSELYNKGFNRIELERKLEKIEQLVKDGNLEKFVTKFNGLNEYSKDFNTVLRAGYYIYRTNYTASNSAEKELLNFEKYDKTKLYSRFIAKYETIKSLYNLSKENRISITPANKVSLYCNVVNLLSRINNITNYVQMFTKNKTPEYIKFSKEMTNKCKILNDMRITIEKELFYTASQEFNLKACSEIINMAAKKYEPKSA